MAFASVLDQYQLTMNMSGGTMGWSEKVFLPQATLGDALEQAVRVVGHRLNCLPVTCQMDWARISLMQGERDAHSVLTSYPAAGLYDPGFTSPETETNPEKITPNLTSDALRYRLETAEGPYSMRFLHGIPDERISADLIKTAIAEVTVDPGDPEDVDPTTVAFHVLVANYLYIVKHETKFVRVRIVDDSKLIEKADIFQLIVRGVEYKKTGRPFGQRPGRATPR